MSIFNLCVLRNEEPIVFSLEEADVFDADGEDEGDEWEDERVGWEEAGCYLGEGKGHLLVMDC